MQTMTTTQEKRRAELAAFEPLNGPVSAQTLIDAELDGDDA